MYSQSGVDISCNRTIRTYVCFIKCAIEAYIRVFPYMTVNDSGIWEDPVTALKSCSGNNRIPAANDIGIEK